jgi:hypothetical protein
MIKPFEILTVRNEPDGTVGVLYKVTYREQISSTVVLSKTLEGYFNMPVGSDVDKETYTYLLEAGWIQ